jgi:hypothetical protein
MCHCANCAFSFRSLAHGKSPFHSSFRTSSDCRVIWGRPNCSMVYDEDTVAWNAANCGIPIKPRKLVYVTAHATQISRTLEHISVCQCETGAKATQETVSGSFEAKSEDKRVVHVSRCPWGIYPSHRPPVHRFSNKHLSMCPGGNSWQYRPPCCHYE